MCPRPYVMYFAFQHNLVCSQRFALLVNLISTPRSFATTPPVLLGLSVVRVPSSLSGRPLTLTSTNPNVFVCSCFEFRRTAGARRFIHLYELLSAQLWTLSVTAARASCASWALRTARHSLIRACFYSCILDMNVLHVKSSYFVQFPHHC